MQSVEGALSTGGALRSEVGISIAEGSLATPEVCADSNLLDSATQQRECAHEPTRAATEHTVVFSTAE
ncbi:hypothetical protein BRD04_01405 [Halobacteriales archaeon QS_9_67_17]|nr:MAG: hypothetical protein BRD04_01405 [Halobacteriales archaeon QS_9_67_17]